LTKRNAVEARQRFPLRPSVPPSNGGARRAFGSNPDRVTPAWSRSVPDEIITPEMAGVLHQRALELSDMAVWVISEDEPGHPGVLVARLVTDRATSYVLTATSLPALRAQLPADLERSERQPGDPEEVLEVWLERTFAPRPFPRPH
jgi:hypothetical protein